MFIKPIEKHWNPEDFQLSEVALSDPLLHITKTICLLESRCDDYADYLRSIFQYREHEWQSAIDQWNSEECQHGVLLRKICESADSKFLFLQQMSQYRSMVSYHAASGQSVRGSVFGELISRCVVEALASTLYRVLADSTKDTECKKAFLTLAKDEAKHYGMFLKMLKRETSLIEKIGFFAPYGYVFRRILELEDNQIMVASYVVAERPNTHFRLRQEANYYLGKLYRLYRWKHLGYAAKMLLQVLDIKPSKVAINLFTLLLLAGIKLRLFLSIVFLKLSPLKAG